MRALIHLATRLFDRPLLCTGSYAGTVASVLADRLGVVPLVSADEQRSYIRPSFSPTMDTATGIAVYPIVGGMVHRGGFVESLSGPISYTQIQNDLGALIDDPRVRGVLLDLDTPGGEAAGIIELTDFIKASSRLKPIWAIANTAACSGGYWLASACSRIIAAPMAHVGSIGVVVMHTDVSKAMEKKGVVSTFVFAGAHKVDGHSYAPLPDDVKSQIQEDIDGLYELFVRSVATNRGLSPDVVRKTEARVYDGLNAELIGLVDDANATFGQTLANFASFLDGAPR